jgi:hypothetical protein
VEMRHAERLAIVASWDEALRADFEERAGIIEYLANETREEAERLAFELLKDKAPMKQSGLGL